MTHYWDEVAKLLVDESVPRRESLRRLGLLLTGVLLGSGAIGGEAVAGGPNSHSWGPPLRRIKSQRSTRRRTDTCLRFCKCRNTKQQSQCLSACRACEGNTSNIRGRCGTYTCVDLTSDTDCGAIGNDCTATGKKCCGGACVDFNSDVSHCGGCGVACGDATPFCINGTCTAGSDECGPGLTRCGDSCVSLSSDVNNCGACGVVCGTGSTCVNGACSGGGDCPAGATRCNGVCTNIAFDTQNCGGCGIVCAAGETCSGGVCQSPF